MRKYLLIASTMLGLSACSGGSDEDAAANAAAEAKPPLMQPGEWEITHKLTGYNYDGLTKEEYDAKLGETVTTKACITDETADRPDATFLASNQGTECTYNNLTPTAGRLSATLTCKSAPGTIDILLDGSSRDGTWMLAEQSTRMAEGKPTVRASADVTATRLGDCPTAGETTTG
ncbi:DUF3617 domain-containing protein [Rhizorhapis sp. SPR117]|uniref:DUF3617 domain-containing protein n=1 Tax=Rhizorhapis sp. SPR117 TaxID=2912611 RepID=UPI001F419A71|nr:DUF3617 domain-containing protein [Rhizorhapis sp. SPR117]